MRCSADCAVVTQVCGCAWNAFPAHRLDRTTPCAMHACREQKLLAQTRRMHAQEEGRIRGKLGERRCGVNQDVDMDMAGDPSLDDSYDDED